MPSDILVLQVAFMACATVVVVAGLGHLRRYLEHRAERRTLSPSDQLMTRLGHIEDAVDSTALEVERIAESNRFLAKLLSDHGGARSPAGVPPKVITPH